MNIKLFFLLLILFPAFTLTFFLQNGVAQDYTQIRLPDGAKARLGKRTVSDITYSPDGKRLAIAGNLGIWIYDVQSGSEIDLITGRWGSIRSVSFSPDGQTLAATKNWNTIYFWDVDTGKVKNTITGDLGSPFSVAFSPDGRTLASGGWDNTIRLWDVKTGTLKHTLGRAGTPHWGDVYNVAFSPDGQMLASGSGDDSIGLWDINTDTLKHIFTGHHDFGRSSPPTNVYSVSFSPDDQMLASGGKDTIYIWDTSTFVPITETLTVDVNGDGVVNIQDLVHVAARMEQNVPVGGDSADVNGDGVINIQDLVQVANAIGD